MARSTALTFVWEEKDRAETTFGRGPRLHLSNGYNAFSPIICGRASELRSYGVTSAYRLWEAPLLVRETARSFARMRGLRRLVSVQSKAGRCTCLGWGFQMEFFLRLEIRGITS